MRRAFRGGGVLFPLFLLLSYLLDHTDGAPPISSTYLNLRTSHVYDTFWVNSTVVYLMTNNGVGVHALYRSTDEGQSWTQHSVPSIMYDPSLTCYVMEIYQDRQNPSQLLFLGNSNCGWKTTNGGDSYQYLVFPRGVQYLSFHPNISGCALAFDETNSKVYITQNLGTSWDPVNATFASWLLTPEYNGLPADSMYLIQSGVFGISKDFGRSFSPIFGNADILYTSANFIYVKMNDNTLMVGRNESSFSKGLFPFGDQVSLFTVSDDVSGATWFLTDESLYWGSIYTAGSSGALYIQSLKHVLKRDDAFLDFFSVHGLPGIHIAQVVVNYADDRDLQLQTQITFDNGGSWAPINAPQPACLGCTLNLYFSHTTLGVRPFYSSHNTIGIVVANGAVGLALSYENPINLNTYISRNAGVDWAQILSGPHHVEFGDHGAILVAAPMFEPTTTVLYSLDEGLTFSTYDFTSGQGPIYVTRLTTERTSTSSKFFLYGISATDFTGIIFGIDFSALLTRICSDSDYEIWAPGDTISSTCWMGRTLRYSRRIRTANCTNDRDTEHLIDSTPCPCTIDDYECDFGYIPHYGGPTGLTCSVGPNLPPDPPAYCNGTYEYSQGYRIIPGDGCQGGKINLRPITKPCPVAPTPEAPHKDNLSWVAVVVVLVVFIILGIIAYIVLRDPSMREKVLSILPSRIGGRRYGRVRQNRASSLAHEDDFAIHDDLLEEEYHEDARILHDHDISKASHSPHSPSDFDPRNVEEL